MLWKCNFPLKSVHCVVVGLLERRRERGGVRRSHAGHACDALECIDAELWSQGIVGEGILASGGGERPGETANIYDSKASHSYSLRN